MKARRSADAEAWEVQCDECGAWQTVPDGESTWDCRTDECPGQLREPLEDFEDYTEGEEVDY